MSSSWSQPFLQTEALKMVSAWQVKFHHKSERSLYWQFYFTWQTNPDAIVQAYTQGQYHPLPMHRCHFPDHTISVWSFQDRLVHHLILLQIKPTFKHIISPNCYHLQGPTGVTAALEKIRQALAKGYQYVIRTDIKGYYSNISHDILSKQLLEAFDDPLLRAYFPTIVSPLIDDNANLTQPSKGLPRRSTLSPFFGALYLTPLDRAFENSKSVVYVRYMDDIVILTQTSRQHRRAKRKLMPIIDSLQLKLSPHKTKIGLVSEGFHFLGVEFPEPRRSGDEIQVVMRIHSRSCRRALDKVIAMTDNAAHPAHVQQYLKRWAIWWYRATGRTILINVLLEAWVAFARENAPHLAWIGQGLIMGETPAEDDVIINAIGSL